MTHRDWRADAACRGAPLDLFLTGDGSDDPYYPSKEALEYCDGCPVRTECLQFALDHDEDGVWGGTTAYQRRQLSRQRERERCPGCGSQDVVFENNIQLCLSCGMSWRTV